MLRREKFESFSRIFLSLKQRLPTFSSKPKKILKEQSNIRIANFTRKKVERSITSNKLKTNKAKFDAQNPF